MGAVTEIQAKCTACGNVWHYLPGTGLQETGEKMQKTGCAMMTCGCSSLFMPKTQSVTSQCPNCGSKAIQKTEVSHTV